MHILPTAGLHAMPAAGLMRSAVLMSAFVACHVANLEYVPKLNYGLLCSLLTPRQPSAQQL